MNRFICLAAVVLLSGPAHGAELALTPQMVVKRALESSFAGRQIQSSRQEKQVWEAKARAPYGFQLDANTSYELARIDALSGLNNPEDRTFVFGVGLKKQFSTGTRIGLDYERIQQTSVLNPFFSNFRPPSLFQDSVGLEISQSLLKDGFGRATRLQSEAARKQGETVSLRVAEEQERLAIQALSLYWNGVVAERQIIASEAALKEYERLSRAVARRANVNFVDPGEKERVDAEYEMQKQQMAEARLARTQLMRQMVDLLRLEAVPGKLAFPSELPPVPVPPRDVDKSREFLIADNQSEAAQSLAKAARANNLPSLDVFGGVRYFGLEGTSGGALDELTSGNKPRYQVGLKLSWDLERNLQRSEEVEARINLQQAELEKQRVSSSLKVREANAFSEVKTRRELAESAQNLVRLRNQGIKAVVKSYRQGRTDLDSVVGAVTAKVAAEVQESRAFANYHIGLAELQALQDTLFEEGTK